MKLIQYLAALVFALIAIAGLHSTYRKLSKDGRSVHWIGNLVVSKCGSDVQPSSEIEIGLHTNGTVVWRKKQ